MLLWHNVRLLVSPNVVWKRWYRIHWWSLKYCLGDILCRMPSFQKGAIFVLPQIVAVPGRQSQSHFQPMRPAKCGSCFSALALVWPQSLTRHLKLYYKETQSDWWRMRKSLMQSPGWLDMLPSTQASHCRYTDCKQLTAISAWKRSFSRLCN